MIKLSVVISGSFAPTLQFEKREIHKVFLRFPNFDLCQNLSLLTFAKLTIGCFLNFEHGISIIYIVHSAFFVL